MGLGIIATAIDSAHLPEQLGNDWGGWAVTALCVLIAIGALKGILPINTGSPILGAWVVFAVATVIWIGRLFFHIPLHFHV